MNHPSSLRGLRPVSDSPLPHFICACRKKTAEIQHLPHSRDNLGQRGFGPELFTFLLRFRLGLETSESFLKGDGQG